MINRERQERTTFNGRTLCWAEFGIEVGRPIMSFHGGNDSRLADGLPEPAMGLLSQCASGGCQSAVCGRRP